MNMDFDSDQDWLESLVDPEEAYVEPPMSEEDRRAKAVADAAWLRKVQEKKA